MTPQEKQMFGVSVEDIRESYLNSLTAKLSGEEMVVMSILSDCQELLSFEETDKERIRKDLNIAKYILSDMMDKRRTA